MIRVHRCWLQMDECTHDTDESSVPPGWRDAPSAQQRVRGGEEAFASAHEATSPPIRGSKYLSAVVCRAGSFPSIDPPISWSDKVCFGAAGLPVAVAAACCRHVLAPRRHRSWSRAENRPVSGRSAFGCDCWSCCCCWLRVGQVALWWDASGPSRRRFGLSTVRLRFEL